MGPILITAPTVEPVSVEEAKLHEHVDDAAEDTLIEVYISAAREQCEHILGRSILPQTWEVSLDCFPSGDIELPCPDALSIKGVYYLDVAGDEVTLPTDQYKLNVRKANKSILKPAKGTTWPTTANEEDAVRIQYEAGYEDVPNVPAPIKLWIKMAVGTWYKNREVVVTGTIVSKIPREFYAGLLDRYRVWRL